MVNELSKFEYKSLMEFTEELYKLEDMRKVLSLIVEHSVRLVSADRSTLYLFDKNRNELYSEFYHGAPLKTIRLPLDGNSVAGYCACLKKRINIKDVYQKNAERYPGLKFNSFFDRFNRYKTKSILCAPLLDQFGRLHGVLSLLNSPAENGFSMTDEGVIDIIARHATIAVTRLQRQEMARVFSEREQQFLAGPRELFVVFFDIIDYTRLSEMHGDKKIRQIIQAWEKDHIRLINSYGGIYIKSVGDEIMSMFGHDSLSDNSDAKQVLEANGPGPAASIEYFKKLKKRVSNLENLKPLILEYERWFGINQKRMSTWEKEEFEKFRKQLWAENVIRFMQKAQKNLNRLNHSLFSKQILTDEKEHLIFMKGGAEFGRVIVGFDFYGRIDVSGDIVNTASRITDQGTKASIISSPVEQPILIGPKMYPLLPIDHFVNTSKIHIRLKGKKDSLDIYIINSIVSFENRSFMPEDKFQNFKISIMKQIGELDLIRQKLFPFNYAAYRIEEKDKYIVDHSKRVAVNALHIVDLINSNAESKTDSQCSALNPDRIKTTAISALLHDIGKYALNDNVKGYIEPTNSIRSLSQEEKEVFNRLTGSFACSILESIEALRPYSFFVKCVYLHFNGFYCSKIYGDNPSASQIPIESRIVSIANAIDSIFTETPFREQLQVQNMIDILALDIENGKSQNRVQKFDPIISSMVIDYYKKEGE